MRTGAVAATLALLLAGQRLAAQPDTVPVVVSATAIRCKAALAGLTLAIAHAGARLVAVGAGGAVLLSDDHGGSWRQAASVSASVLLTSVRFASPQEGWAAGHLGIILHTTDGGEHWVRQMDGVAAARLSAQAAARLPDGPARDAAMKAADQLVSDGPDKPFFALQVSPRGAGKPGQDVLAVGAYGLALRSRDAGASWVSAAADVPDPQGLHMYRVAQSPTASYVVGEQGLFLISPDGERFAPRITPYPGTFFGAAISRSGAVLAFGLQGKLFRSADGGARWSEIRTGIADTITCGITLRNGTMLFGSQTGEMLASKDDGGSVRSLGKLSPSAIMGMAEDGGAVVVVGPGGPLRIALPSADAS